MAAAEDEAYKLLRDELPAIQRMAEALMAAGVLSGDALQDLLGKEQSPET